MAILGQKKGTSSPTALCLTVTNLEAERRVEEQEAQSDAIPECFTSSAFLSVGSVGASGFDFVVCSEYYLLTFSHFVTDKEANAPLK